MGKVKINLPTGVSVEKVLMNCFKVEDNVYVVLDANNVGSMGLPIILISKLANNRLVKIVDTDEWTKLKGFLKEIISGVNKEYVALQDNLDADELFYNQLTLPVASFDALKNAYQVPVAAVMDVPAVAGSGVVDELDSGVIDTQKVEQTLVAPSNVDVVSNEAVNNVEKVEPSVPELTLPVLDSPVVQEAEVVPAATQNEAVANPLIDDISLPSLDLPVVEEVSPVTEDIVVNSETSKEVPVMASVIEPSVPSIDLPVVEEVSPITENPVVNSEASNEVPVIDSVIEPSVPSIDLPVVNESVDASVEVESNINSLDLSVEKEEFMKFCGEFFDKMIEKIKNN